jgi:arginyl-tRNA synthetase
MAVVGAADLVEGAIARAMARVLAPALAGADPLVRRSERADFQSNVAFALAKRANRAALVRLTGATLAQGLDLLGLAAPPRL